MRPATRGSEANRLETTLAGEHEQLPGRGRGAAEPPEPEAIGSTDVCVHSSVVAVSYVFVYSVIK